MLETWFWCLSPGFEAWEIHWVHFQTPQIDLALIWKWPFVFWPVKMRKNGLNCNFGSEHARDLILVIELSPVWTHDKKSMQTKSVTLFWGPIPISISSILFWVDNMVYQESFTILCLHNMLTEIIIYIIISPRVLPGIFLYKDEYHSFCEYFQRETGKIFPPLYRRGKTF